MCVCVVGVVRWAEGERWEELEKVLFFGWVKWFHNFLLIGIELRPLTLTSVGFSILQ